MLIIIIATYFSNNDYDMYESCVLVLVHIKVEKHMICACVRVFIITYSVYIAQG